MCARCCEGSSEGFKQAALDRIRRLLVFGVPLHGEQEAVGRIFEGFDDPVFGILCCHQQARSQAIDGLMVA